MLLELKVMSSDTMEESPTQMLLEQIQQQAKLTRELLTKIMELEKM